MNNVKITSRIMAYLLDIVLVFFFVQLITSIRFINPQYDKYIETADKYNKVYNSYLEKEINEIEFIEQNKENHYYLSKYSVSYNIVLVIVLIAYYGLFQKFNNGQTLGKKIMKIRVVGLDNHNSSVLSYIIRLLPLFFVYIGGLLPTIINAILVYVLNSNNYMTITTVINYAFLLLGIASFVIAYIRKDKRGLHDLLAKTKVVIE